jgi:hypothetical protein
MCVLLCANSNVRSWVDIPQALAYRQALQMCTLCLKAEVYEAQLREWQSKPIANFESDEATQPRIMKRSAWVQAYCRYRAHLAQQGKRLAACGNSSASSNEWQKALEALTKTWGRLLSLVGLRW